MDTEISASNSVVTIDFGEQGNSALFRREGWSSQESSFVWGTGPRSNLRLRIESHGRPLILEAEIVPCRTPPAPSGQIVRVQVNGTAIGGTRLDNRSMIRCQIDPAIIRDDGIMDIEFGFPGFFRPKALRHSPDVRPLSGAFRFVSVYTNRPNH